MSYRKPFSAYQVLHAWLEVQLGTCRNVRPRGFEMPGDACSTWGNTKARAAALVESIPQFRSCRLLLMEWCMTGPEEVGLVAEFMAALEGYLREFPFYPSTMEDSRSEGELVSFRDVASVASEIGVSESYLRKWLSVMPTSLPFGSFSDRRTWMIHPMDVAVLRGHFEGIRR